MKKEYELDLHYFNDGLASCLERFPNPNEAAKALVDHSELLECDAETLRTIARYVRKGQIKLSGLDKGGLDKNNVLRLSIDESLGRRLVKKVSLTPLLKG
jgi:hypothetical protein